MSKRNNELYLQDILDSINKILKYTSDFSFDDFKNNTITVDAVIRNLEIIGEAASHIDSKLRKDSSDIPWAHMVAMRNKMTHEYFGVDVEILWQTIQHDLPTLKKLIQKIND